MVGRLAAIEVWPRSRTDTASLAGEASRVPLVWRSQCVVAISGVRSGFGSDATKHLNRMLEQVIFQRHEPGTCRITEIGLPAALGAGRLLEAAIEQRQRDRLRQPRSLHQLAQPLVVGIRHTDMLEDGGGPVPANVPGRTR